MKKILIILPIIFLFFPVFNFVFSAASTTSTTINLSCKEKGSSNQPYPWCEITEFGGSSGLVNQFYNYALAAVGVAALGAIIYGGILYTMSAGNPSGQQEAISWITGAVYGLILLLAANLLLRTINPELVKLKLGELKKVDISTEEQKNYNQFRDIVESATTNKKLNTVEVLNSINGIASIKNNNPCITQLSKDCVQINNMNKSTLDEIRSLSIQSKLPPSNIVITAGTEGDIHADGAKSHANGYKVDIRSKNEGQALTNYIENNFIASGYRVEKDGTKSPQYINPKTGAIYVKEHLGSDNEHWDISAAPKI